MDPIDMAIDSINGKVDGLLDIIAKLKADNDRLREALQEVAKGEGPFSRDQLTHAQNTIEAMKEIALNALQPKAETAQ